MVLFQNCVRQSRSPTKMATTVQLRCYWKRLWSRWAITGSWEPLIGSYVKLSTAVQPSWSEGGTTRYNFGKEPFNDYFIKIWFQLSNWFQTRRFLCESLWEIPIKIFLFETICSIRTKCWWNSHWMGVFLKYVRRFSPSTKMVLQWLFHQSLVLIELLVPDKMVFMWISDRVLC
jgi:hypothetical protein